MADPNGLVPNSGRQSHDLQQAIASQKAIPCRRIITRTCIITPVPNKGAWQFGVSGVSWKYSRIPTLNSKRVKGSLPQYFWPTEWLSQHTKPGLFDRHSSGSSCPSPPIHPSPPRTNFCQKRRPPIPVSWYPITLQYSWPVTMGGMWCHGVQKTPHDSPNRSHAKPSKFFPVHPNKVLH